MAARRGSRPTAAPTVCLCLRQRPRLKAAHLVRFSLKLRLFLLSSCGQHSWHRLPMPVIIFFTPLEAFSEECTMDFCIHLRFPRLHCQANFSSSSQSPAAKSLPPSARDPLRTLEGALTERPNRRLWPCVRLCVFAALLLLPDCHFAAAAAAACARVFRRSFVSWNGLIYCLCTSVRPPGMWSH
jgi:hypothetical protein